MQAKYSEATQKVTKSAREPAEEIDNTNEKRHEALEERDAGEFGWNTVACDSDGKTVYAKPSPLEVVL